MLYTDICVQEDSSFFCSCCCWYNLSLLLYLVQLSQSLIDLLIVLALLVGMSQFHALIHTIIVLMTALVQLYQNMCAVISPGHRNPSILHFLLRCYHLCYGMRTTLHTSRTLLHDHDKCSYNKMIKRETNWVMGFTKRVPLSLLHRICHRIRFFLSTTFVIHIQPFSA